ncbi:PAAR domain-containing protein [Burkholderia vietnamiensis]|uniref:PAAR domain-containing protein n=1 Tax=Burkholderia vietnamiensis TaxID=60552 RepID=UPI001BA34949|nr:PAAR domain-containing protein [Burkholderia vietnamiensis]MBR7974061.1 PAAR domain-containing protein [Burkholderia vietnamiensis]
MKRYLLKIGDKSSNGGIVIEGIAGCTHHGTELTFVGAKVDCRGCNSTGFIVAQGPRQSHTMMGKQQALASDVCSCKCTPPPVMIASQTSAYHTFESYGSPDTGHSSFGESLTDAYRGAFDEQVRVLDAPGNPIVGTLYHIKTADGAIYKGLTDVSGYCPRVYTDDVSRLDIAIGMQALERWES